MKVFISCKTEQFMPLIIIDMMRMILILSYHPLSSRETHQCNYTITAYTLACRKCTFAEMSLYEGESYMLSEAMQSVIWTFPSNCNAIWTYGSVSHVYVCCTVCVGWGRFVRMCMLYQCAHTIHAASHFHVSPIDTYRFHRAA